MRIKNWEKFQHFKDRKPIWIKLYRNILDQRDINLISDCSFRVLVGLWLLASEDYTNQGNLPPIEDICFRLRKDKQTILNCIQELSSFLIQDDINLVSNGYQPDALEKRREREREEKEKRENEGVFANANQSGSPNSPDVAHLEDEVRVVYEDENQRERKKRQAQYLEQAKEVLGFLNERVGRNYQPVSTNLNFIVARLKEGASVDDCRSVIAKKRREWIGDEKMAMFLRPATLFNRTKFAQYVGELKESEASDGE